MRHRPDRRDEYRIFRRGWRIHTGLRALADGLAKIVLHILGRRIGILQPWPWEVPMDVGMGAREGVPAMLTAAAGSRLGADAEEPLSEPEREPLLADAQRPLKEQRPRERVAPDRLIEALAQRLVAVESKEGHSGKVRRAGPFRGVVPPKHDGHGS